MSRNFIDPSSVSSFSPFEEKIISQFTDLINVVSQGFVYIIVIMSIFYFARQFISYRSDRTTSQNLDDKLERTITVLDEKLSQY